MQSFIRQCATACAFTSYTCFMQFHFPYFFSFHDARDIRFEFLIVPWAWFKDAMSVVQ